MSRAAVILAAIVLVIAAIRVAPLSGATFTDSTSNPSNSIGTASSFCPNPGTVTLGASKDSYVDEAAASTTHGGATTLDISPGLLLGLLGNQRTLVEFPLGQISSFCTVTGATLRLYATSPASGRTISVRRPTAAWSESTVTWNNQPGVTGTAVSIASGSSAGWRAWNVLGHISAMISGANNGFYVRDDGGSVLNLTEQRYQSREGTPDSQDPELVLTLQ